MRQVRLLALAGAAAIALAGCQSAGSRGAPPVAYAPTPAERPAVGLAGNAIAPDLSAKDLRAALEAEYRALEYGRTGAPVVWRGRSRRGEVIAGPRYRINDYDCRDYTHIIATKRRTERAHGTSCRRPNGAWEPVG